MKFSVFLLLLQAVFIIFFGIFVDYDAEAGARNQTSSAENNEHFEVLYPMFQDVHVMVFIGFGFLMTFLKRYGYGSAAFNLLLAAFVIQWATLMRGALSPELASHGKILLTLDTIMNAEFAAAAVLISFGAVLGVFSPMQLMVMSLFEVVVYAVNEWILVEHFEINDIGGSMIIHTFGAYFGLAVSSVHWRRSLADNPKEDSVYHADIFSMIGTIFLWLFWPSFNGALAAGTPIAQRCVTNTIYSIVASAVGAFAMSSVIDKKNKLSMAHIQNSTLAGGVVAGAVANLYISPSGALIIGTSAGILSVVGYKYVTPALARAFHLHDTCGVHNLHGMPGVMSAFIAVVVARFTTASTLDAEELAAIYPGIEESRDFHHQANMQMAGLAVTLGMSIVGGLLTGAVLHIPVIVDVTDGDDLFDDKKYWIVGDDETESSYAMNENVFPFTPSKEGMVVEEQGQMES